MKMAYYGLEMQFIFDENQINEWIIESPEYFLNFMQELMAQHRGEEGKFVLSHEGSILNISKSMEVIVDPLSININDKRILNKVYENIVEISREEGNYMDTQRINQTIFSYLLKLEAQCNYYIEMNREVDISLLLKAAGAQLGIAGDSFLDALVRYIELVYELLHKKLIALINIRSYLSDSQMSELIKMMQYRKIPIWGIENRKKGCLSGMRQYIIDEDGCEIF